MQPAAAEVEGDAGRRHDGVGAPANAIARLQHDDGETGIFQRMRGAKAGGAGADDRDIDGGGEGRHAFDFSTFVIGLEANRVYSVIIRKSG